MKVSIEIKDNKFHYSWSLGNVCNETGEIELTPKGLALVSDLISNLWRASDDKLTNKIKLAEAVALVKKEKNKL